MLETTRTHLATFVLHAVREFLVACGQSGGAISESGVSRAGAEAFGEYSTNVALRLAKAVERPALDVARELGPGKTVVTVLADTGERYFSMGSFLNAGREEPRA